MARGGLEVVMEQVLSVLQSIDQRLQSIGIQQGESGESRPNSPSTAGSSSTGANPLAGTRNESSKSGGLGGASLGLITSAAGTGLRAAQSATDARQGEVLSTINAARSIPFVGTAFNLLGARDGEDRFRQLRSDLGSFARNQAEAGVDPNQLDPKSVRAFAESRVKINDQVADFTNNGGLGDVQGTAAAKAVGGPEIRAVIGAAERMAAAADKISSVIDKVITERVILGGGGDFDALGLGGLGGSDLGGGR